MARDHLETPRRLYLPEDLEVRPATPADDEFLYRLLEERYSRPEINVRGTAAEKLPTFEEHQAYLRRRPYARLEIVSIDGVDAGMWSLRPDNVGGCFVLRRYVSRGLGLATCYRLLLECEPPITAHFNPANRSGYRTVERLGFVRTHASADRLTYTLLGAPVNPFRPRPTARAGLPE